VEEKKAPVQLICGVLLLHFPFASLFGGGQWTGMSCPVKFCHHVFQEFARAGVPTAAEICLSKTITHRVIVRLCVLIHVGTSCYRGSDVGTFKL
jgi:hypothetical protein